MNQQTPDLHPCPTKLQQMLVRAGLPLPEEIFADTLAPAILVSSLGIVCSCGLCLLALLLTAATWNCVPSDGGWGCDVVAWSGQLWPANALLDALQVCWVLLCGLALTLCVLFLRHRCRHRYLCVYPWGLLVPPDLTFPWDRAWRIWRGWEERLNEQPRIRLDAIRLQRDDGKTFAFRRAPWNRRTTEQRTALFDRIERACLQVQLPGLLEQFDRGEWLSFGPLLLSRSGLVHQGWGEVAWMDWEEVARFEINETALQLQGKRSSPTSRPRRDWTVSVPDLPNAYLLRALVQARSLPRTGGASAW